MKPFWPLLSPHCTFLWDEKLDDAFKQSKLPIINVIRHGVKIGIDYLLLQEHCNCISEVPDCCEDGWCFCMVGCRFPTSAEQRYAPIESHALALVWGLEQTKFFTLGCNNLSVVTNHKPLVKIFGDRALDEITNMRLFRLKQRALPWYFKIAHLTSATNYATGAASWHPIPVGGFVSQDYNKTKAIITAAIRKDTESMIPITWELIRNETSKDAAMTTLLIALRSGFPDELHHLDLIIP